jgi:hypothetical protein
MGVTGKPDKVELQRYTHSAQFAPGSQLYSEDVYASGGDLRPNSANMGSSPRAEGVPEGRIVCGDLEISYSPSSLASAEFCGHGANSKKLDVNDRCERYFAPPVFSAFTAHV